MSRALTAPLDKCHSPSLSASWLSFLLFLSVFHRQDSSCDTQIQDIPLTLVIALFEYCIYVWYNALDTVTWALSQSLTPKTLTSPEKSRSPAYAAPCRAFLYFTSPLPPFSLHIQLQMASCPPGLQLPPLPHCRWHGLHQRGPTLPDLCDTGFRWGPQLPLKFTSKTLHCIWAGVANTLFYIRSLMLFDIYTSTCATEHRLLS